MKLTLSCGHQVILASPGSPLLKRPRGSAIVINYPIIDEHPVEVGDVFTCPRCDVNEYVEKAESN